MAMNVTESGIEWARLLPEDFEEVAVTVTEAAHECPEGDPNYVHRNGWREVAGRHYLDSAGRVVCTSQAWRALNSVGRYGNNPLKRATKEKNGLI